MERRGWQGCQLLVGREQQHVAAQVRVHAVEGDGNGGPQTPGSEGPRQDCISQASESWNETSRRRQVLTELSQAVLGNIAIS